MAGVPPVPGTSALSFVENWHARHGWHAVSARYDHAFHYEMSALQFTPFSLLQFLLDAGRHKNRKRFHFARPASFLAARFLAEASCIEPIDETAPLR